ncbi:MULTISPECIES: DUF2807 domain-containing protein [unclassified Pseudoxanthomonas]|uniref:GIN domain-containing protein n=1 Tax=unclassified Pseudoxanthomonas TaxID=2645906 RepID=UPI0030777949
MRKSILSLLLLLPVAAFAEDQCKLSQPRNLSLDLSGVKAVVFELAQHDLKLEASPGAKGDIQGTACASHEKNLAQLQLTQQRVGDKLIVRAHREGQSIGLFFGDNYAYLKLRATLPDNIPVQLKVGSGDADVSGVSVFSADVGSGDVIARRVRGLAAASVGSGDIELDDVGSLHVISIGSGDVAARRVRGGVKVGSIGSGDFELDGARGRVEIGSIGSGDAQVRDIDGDVEVGSIGSGNASVRDVRGKLTLRSKGSGSIDHSGVTGETDLPKDR